MGGVGGAAGGVGVADVVNGVGGNGLKVGIRKIVSSAGCRGNACGAKDGGIGVGTGGVVGIGRRKHVGEGGGEGGGRVRRSVGGV